MKTPKQSWIVGLGLLLFLGIPVGSTGAQNESRFDSLQVLTNRETLLKLSAAKTFYHRIDVTTDLAAWDPLVILAPGTGTYQHTDSATPYLDQRFYRAQQLEGTNWLAGDELPTTNGGVTIHPINHATFVLSWQTNTIYFDPVRGASRFQGLRRANLIFITHDHSDHFDNTTLTAVKGTNAVIVAPSAVYQQMTASLKALTTVMANGEANDLMGLSILAVPAYNLTTQHHLKGVGNGYVLTIGGRRLYIAGDTEDIPEMRALQDIDIAFVPINQPYTMTVPKAVSAVREFRPKVVYPYHYSGIDMTSFKRSLGTDLGIEVRLRAWY